MAIAHEERIQIGGQYYLVAASRASYRQKAILSHEDVFGVFDLSGDIPTAGTEDLGVFFHGTRHLDRFELRLNGDVPLFLSSRISDDNVQLVTEMTNADVSRDGKIVVPRDTIALHRVKILVDDRLYESIELASFHDREVRCELLLMVSADFADIFELRGLRRPSRGELLAPEARRDGLLFRYRGRDGRERATRITVDAPLEPFGPTGFLHVITLAPGQRARLEVSVGCELGGVAPTPRRGYEAAADARRGAERTWLASQASIDSSNDFFNELMARSTADLAMLRSTTNGEPYVYAGIPWFATMFGRDGIITALETLAFAPAIAHGTLHRLAALQGVEVNAARDEQPGKIVHEVRDDEMAVCGEVPFGRYYGSVDSTPLFLVLAAAYVRRTGDLATAEALWPSLERALEWIERYGDRDGDGYVEYHRETPDGLANQGWKDSHDAIFHRDGRIAEPPIALVEVQGYVYAARRGLAYLATRLGKHALARDLVEAASALRRRFHDDFWIADECYYAIALDAEKRRCEIVSSNPGHCLWTGLIDREHAAAVIARLTASDMFCGWGIRTLSETAPRFNPMSYHDGSVWPHDNALIAAGFRRYGAVDAAVQVMTGLFDTSLFVDHARLPELFCGFERRPHGTPVPYPVACRPQAWAAASPFLILQAMLGLRFDPSAGRIVFHRPALPPWLEWLVIRDLRLGPATLDVRIDGPRRSSSVDVLRRTGNVEVLIRK